MDRVADGLVVAAEGVDDLRGALAARGGEDGRPLGSMAAPQGEGIGRAESGCQRVAFGLRQGTDQKGCLHGGEDTTCSTTSSE